MEQESVMTCWQNFDRLLNTDAAYPLRENKYALSEVKSDLNAALTILLWNCIDYKKRVMQSISNHEMACLNLLSISDFPSHKVYVFKGSSGADLKLLVAQNYIESQLLMKDNVIYKLHTPFDLRLRDYMGDDCRYLDYESMIHHHLNLLFIECKAWERMIVNRVREHM